MMGRYLVTTAIEETWPSDGAPLLFLGEWCRLYGRKRVWENRDAIVAPYHWDNRDKLYEDYLYLQGLHEELLDELAAKLNAVHVTGHSTRYWRILVGPWLGYFIPILFDRWSMLRQVLRDNDISGVQVIQGGCGRIPDGMVEFSSMIIGDEWNEEIYGQLLAWTGIPVEKVNVPLAPVKNTLGLGCGRKVKRVLAQLLSHISGILCRENEYFFFNSHLPVCQDLLLQLKLGQIPKIWRSVAPPTSSVTPEIRQWQVPGPVNAEDFPAIARAMIPMHIPTAYLEGYRHLLSVSENMPWPKCPKAIFSSNPHWSDDVFKIWTANKAEHGAPLVVGQHGGSYGLMKWFFNEDHEKSICDLFLTWGWEEPLSPKFKPVGMIKHMGEQKKKTVGSNARLLLVEQSLSRYSYKMSAEPVSSTFVNYINEQFSFVGHLPKKIRELVLVRLYPADYGWGGASLWHDRCSDVQIGSCKDSYYNQMLESRIVVSTYNATTYLESFIFNVPTIMFWNPKHWELRDEAIPFFNLLKEVGIFHETPESAAAKVAEVWDDVPGWWWLPEIQRARKHFCHRFAGKVDKPIAVLKDLLESVASQKANALID